MCFCILAFAFEFRQDWHVMMSLVMTIQIVWLPLRQCLWVHNPDMIHMTHQAIEITGILYQAKIFFFFFWHPMFQVLTLFPLTFPCFCCDWQHKRVLCVLPTWIKVSNFTDPPHQDMYIQLFKSRDSFTYFIKYFFQELMISIKYNLNNRLLLTGFKKNFF